LKNQLGMIGAGNITSQAPGQGTQFTLVVHGKGMMGLTKR
jgi:hypothetical protein